MTKGQQFIIITLIPPGEISNLHTMVHIKTNKQRILHRMKIAHGHLKKVIEMLEKDEYCIDILHNSLAVQKALKSTDMLIMEDHLKTCAVDQIRKGDESQVVRDLISIYKYK